MVLNNNNEPPNDNELRNEIKQPKENNDCVNCRGRTTQLLQMILTKQNEIFAHLRTNAQHGNQNNDDPENNVRLPRLPVTTKVELLELENLLNESDLHCRKYRKELQILGGQNLRDQVSAVMRFTMMNEVGKMTTWTGQRTGSYKFADTKVASVIMDVIVSKYSQTLDDIRKRVSLWLQKSGNRIKKAIQ